MTVSELEKGLKEASKDMQKPCFVANEDFDSLYSWLVWAVGDLVAADLVKEWEA